MNRGALGAGTQRKRRKAWRWGEWKVPTPKGFSGARHGFRDLSVIARAGR